MECRHFTPPVLADGSRYDDIPIDIVEIEQSSVTVSYDEDVFTSS